MKRVIVIGCPGSGKSTFARHIRDLTGLPLYYLDMIWHKPDGTNITQTAFDEQLMRIMANPEWIIDGNYLKSMPIRLEACDTVFLLDYRVEICLTNAEARIGKKREDLPFIETEFATEFKQWILHFPTKQLPEIYELLKRFRRDKQIVVFKSGREAADYLKNLLPHGPGVSAADLSGRPD